MNLTERQRGLLRELEDRVTAGGKHHSPHSSSWLDGVKNYFGNKGFWQRFTNTATPQIVCRQAVGLV